MFFFLSKTAGFFALPSNVIFTLGTIGLLLLPTRFVRAGRRLVVTSLVLLLAVGIVPIGPMLHAMLEHRFPPWRDGDGPPPNGIVVLGGVISPEVTAARGMVTLGDAAERVTEIASLARRYPAARIVFSGGNASVFGGPAEADHVVGLLSSFGIAPSRIEIETKSRNTAENARFTKALVAPKAGERWLLVTSAAHMPRAIGCFRKAEFPVEAYPVDWHTTGGPITLSLLLPPSPVLLLGATDGAVREWVGLLVYWLTGRTSELFPGPVPNQP
jgi:uncharacterized SAM-binding protein YcdF (DUF218 family)